MSKPKLDKTYSSFSRNPEVNRANEVRRDNDTIKTPKVTIYDVDYAIMDFMRKEIQPKITENDNVIDVPIIYANGEKWAQIQSKGFMYDAKGKIMTPLISIRRTNVTERDTLKSLGVNQNPADNSLTFQNKFTKTNTYDRFSVMQGRKPKKEYYLAPVPEYVEVGYEMLIWSEYQQQMNEIIAAFAAATSTPSAFKITHNKNQYEAFVSPEYSLDNNSSGLETSERIFRTTITFNVLGHIIGSGKNQETPNVIRRESAAKIQLQRERVILGDEIEYHFGRKDKYRP